jgi:hypothetical protein
MRLSHDWDLHVRGEVLAYSTSVTWSDERLKTGVEVVESALTSIMALRTVTFEWSDAHAHDKDKGISHYGLIAQEVQNVLPLLVKERHNPFGESQGRYLTVNYVEIVPLLVKGMQEQQARIEILEADLRILKGEAA